MEIHYTLYLSLNFDSRYMTNNQADSIIDKINESGQFRYLYFGTYFGFPACCIFNFRRHNKARKDNYYLLDGTGFIPCDHCYSSKSIKQLLSEISKDRICHTQFPKQPKELKEPEYLLPQEVTNTLNKFKKRLLPLDYSLFV